MKAGLCVASLLAARMVHAKASAATQAEVASSARIAPKA